MNYYDEIKNNLLNNEAYKKIKDYSKNRSDLNTYYRVGKLLSEAGKHYGEGIIKEYSIRLSKELNKKYTVSLLYKVKQLYLINEKVPTLSGKLTWSHWYEMLSIKDINKIIYYVRRCEINNWDVRSLRSKIKSNEYERFEKTTREKLSKLEEPAITDLVLNPILIQNNSQTNISSERILHQLILEDISSFMEKWAMAFLI